MGLLDEVGKQLKKAITPGQLPFVPGKIFPDPLEELKASPIAELLGVGGRRGVPRGDEEEEEVPDDKKALSMGIALLLEEASENLIQSLSNIGEDPDEFAAALLAMNQALSVSSEREDIFARIDIATATAEILGGDDAEISAADLQKLAELSEQAEALVAPTEEVEELTPEDEAFQELLRRGTELDVLLKEQQLEASQQQQEFAGITNLLDLLPNKQRVAIMADLLGSPIGREFFFGGPTTSGPAGGGAVGPTVLGEAGGFSEAALRQFKEGVQ